MKKKIEKEDLIFKVVKIGDNGAGKTEIIDRYISNYNENSMLTIGISFGFKEVTLNNWIKITLKLIDNTSQAQYKSLSKSYCKNCDAALFEFSLINLQKFL